MKRFYLLSCFCICSFTSCITNVSTNPTAENLEINLTAFLQESIDHSHGSSDGVAMAIEGPNFSWSDAYGFDSKQKDDSIGVHQPFRIASVTKTYTAAAILRLHEMDSLSIHSPISHFISEKHDSILRSANYNPDQITIKHCLHHTAGFYNYARVDNEFADILLSEPTKRWTRTEQLSGATQWGEKVGEPGELYSYCDTGYIILGEIIGSFFNGDYAIGLRQLLHFDRLELDATWLETLESHTMENDDPVHRYFRSTDVTSADPSLDLYGGGGLMSTCADVARFIQLLFTHNIYDKESTLDLMLSKATYASTYKPSEDNRYQDYRLGIIEIELFGETVYTHSGFWGTLYVYVPSSQTSFVTNGTRSIDQRLLKKAVLTMNNHQDNI